MKQNGHADIITVWGSPGSGKSIFSALIAAYLERRKLKVLIISPNRITPMLPIFFPKAAPDNVYSIGHLFELPQMTEADIAKHIFFTRQHPDIGVLAFAPGDTAMRYPDLTKVQAEALLDGVTRMADMVILDCSSDMREVFPYVAAASADITVQMLTADLRGVSFINAQKPLLSAPQFRYEEHITVLGGKKPFQSETGIVRKELVFPWKTDIETAFCDGTVFDALPSCSRKHEIVLETVLDRMKGGKPSGRKKSESHNPN